MLTARRDSHDLVQHFVYHVETDSVSLQKPTVGMSPVWSSQLGAGGQ